MSGDDVPAAELPPSDALPGVRPGWYERDGGGDLAHRLTVDVRGLASHRSLCGRTVVRPRRLDADAPVTVCSSCRVRAERWAVASQGPAPEQPPPPSRPRTAHATGRVVPQGNTAADRVARRQAFGQVVGRRAG